MPDEPSDHDVTALSDTQTTTGRRFVDPILLVFIVAVIATNLLDGQIVPTPIRVILDTGLVALAVVSLVLATVHGLRWYTNQSNHD
jgi:hypothetical protein